MVGNNRIPKQLDNKYVYTLVDAFITNGNGVCYDAEPIYIKLIKQFNQEQITIAVFFVYERTYFEYVTISALWKEISGTY